MLHTYIYIYDISSPRVNLIIVSLTCFEHPSVHPQEDLYIQFYGISVMHPYKQQSGQWQDVLQHILPSTRLLIWMHERNTYHKTACTSLPEDEHLDVRNMLKTLELN